MEAKTTCHSGCGCGHGHNKGEKRWEIALPILSFILLIAGLILDHTGQSWFSPAVKLVWYLTAFLPVGLPVMREAYREALQKDFFTEFSLMSIASIGAFSIGEYPEAVAVMLFYQVGEFFEHYAVNNSRKSIADLMDIKAEFANKLVDGKEITVEPEELTLGDLILVKPGEKIPVDGIVIEGNSSLDTAALTGESVPRDVGIDDEIISGTINLTGVLKVKVTKLYEDSTVAKVLDLVENSGSRKASVEKFITKFAHYYTPIVVGLAILLALVPPLLLSGQHFDDWLYRAMIFLVISCPCALVISVPLSLFAGVGSASKQGILVKGSNYLEALAHVKAFAFDKTGTLTTGKFAVTKVHTMADATEDQLLEIAAHGESLSNHPIALSIVQHFGKVDSSQVTNYEEISGKGVSGIYKGKKTARWEREYERNDREAAGVFCLRENAGPEIPAGAAGELSARRPAMGGGDSARSGNRSGQARL